MDGIGNALFRHHTRIVFGPGVLAALPAEVLALGLRRALVVCDPGITRLGLADRVVAVLAGGGVECTCFDALSENPRDAECCAAAAAAEETGADVVIGLGGGSAMDAAKAAAALVTNGGTVKDWEDPRQLEHEPLPLVCIPTTAGTGSEVTFVAVITDEVDHYKMALRGTGLGPAVAVIDPELTLSLPPYGSTVGTRLTVGGLISGVDEALAVQVRSLSGGLIGSVAGVPAGGQQQPWRISLTLTPASGPAIVAVSTGGHLRTVERFAITAVRT